MVCWKFFLFFLLCLQAKLPHSYDIIKRYDVIATARSTAESWSIKVVYNKTVLDMSKIYKVVIKDAGT